MQKRGLSAVLVTLIIILLSLVAVGIVWAVVRNVIQSETKDVSLSQFALSAKIMDVSVDNSSNNISLTVKRNAGKGNLSAISFVFSNGVDSEVLTKNVSLNELEQIRFVFHLNTSVSDLTSVSIYPLINQDGKQILGLILNKYTLGKIKETPVQCTPVTCLSLGYQCGSGYANGTCSGTLSCGTCGTGYSCISGTCQATSPLCNNLVLLMHFDNNSAAGENDTFVYDWTGDGNNGIVANHSRMNMTGGKYGGSFYFENKDDFIYTSGFSSRANMSGTLSFWIYYKESQYGDGFVVFDNPFSLAALDGLSGFNASHLTYQRTRWYYSGYATTGAEAISNSNISMNQWNLYTLTWNQTSGRIYRNGVLDKEDSTVALPYTNLIKMYVGSDRGISGRAMNGSIDELALWNRTLSDSEISGIYSSSTAINC